MEKRIAAVIRNAGVTVPLNEEQMLAVHASLEEYVAAHRLTSTHAQELAKAVGWRLVARDLAHHAPPGVQQSALAADLLNAHSVELDDEFSAIRKAARTKAGMQVHEKFVERARELREAGNALLYSVPENAFRDMFSNPALNVIAIKEGLDYLAAKKKGLRPRGSL